MDKTWLTKSSFKFGTLDMYAEFGIMLSGEPEDVLLPALRQRKVIIPQRSGAYDFGAKYYDERQLTLPCVTTRTLSREAVREIAYHLSRKAEIRVWNEPNKYYIGRLYNAVNLEQLRRAANRFTLDFICEPFAYGSTVTEAFSGTSLSVEYNGTAATPTYIVITNTGSTAITGLRITQIDRKENY